MLGESISGNTFSQMVNYGRPVFGGFMNATASISENMVAFSQDQTSIGTYENIAYTRGLDGWELNVSGNYSRSNRNRPAGIYELPGTGTRLRFRVNSVREDSGMSLPTARRPNTTK